ncbi:transposase [Vreelandella titanicae]|uniref:transposase n=1 Tax=Vreelandella titanicae TaxID=664683 RepID=UPI004043F4D8
MLQCRHCPKKYRCMQNPSSADHRNGAGRQVSFIIENKRLPNYTDWMKHRVDSPKGKEIYSHRMSVVEPVFGNIGTTKVSAPITPSRQSLPRPVRSLSTARAVAC